MKVDVLISFPCDPAEWDRLCKIHTMFSGNVHVHVDRPESVQPFSEKMTENEARLLDEMSRAAHEQGATPFMDALEEKVSLPKRKRGGLKSSTSVRALMEGFLSTNGAATLDQIVSHMIAAKPDKAPYNLKIGIYMAGRQLGVIRKEGLWHLPSADA